MQSSLRSICFAVAALATAATAGAAGPSSCPAGKTALAQRYGSSSYCALSVCVTEYKHADVTSCSAQELLNPLNSCVYTKYEARPRFPQPPSPAGSWGNQPACSSALNNAAWY
jgi:hypothetical protein